MGEESLIMLKIINTSWRKRAVIYYAHIKKVINGSVATIDTKQTQKKYGTWINTQELIFLTKQRIEKIKE